MSSKLSLSETLTESYEHFTFELQDKTEVRFVDIQRIPDINSSLSQSLATIKLDSELMKLVLFVRYIRRKIEII